MSGIIQDAENIGSGLLNSGSNLFEEVLKDAGAVEQRLLGPTYPYYKNIKTPKQLGMSDTGTLSQMATDINGLIQYVEVLVTGNSQASATGGPLGNKFFLQTGAKCAAVDKCTTDSTGNSSCQSVDRYIYIDNVPVGNIPFISSGLGVDFSEFKGLIPGAMGNLNVLNPFAIMRAFASGSTPPCQQLTMQTIDVNNNQSTETQYVTLADIGNMDPCTFSNGFNPVTKASCQETFQTGVGKDASPVMSDDPIDQLYFASLAIVGIFILYRFMEKSR
jgi:hypothetical protein